MDFLLSLLSGVISGVVASGVFYLYMTRLRPNIFICDLIAKSSNDKGTFFAFKIYNSSNRFDILDLKAELLLKTPFNSDGGQNFRISKIDLVRDKVMILPRCSKKNNKEGDFALILTTREDIDQLWNSDSQHIEFHIQAKHSFSGATKSYTKKFYTKRTSIKEGMFTFGKTNSVT